jgi:hypothetical protein
MLSQQQQVHEVKPPLLGHAPHAPHAPHATRSPYEGMTSAQDAMRDAMRYEGSYEGMTPQEVMCYDGMTPQQEAMAFGAPGAPTPTAAEQADMVGLYKLNRPPIA